MSEKNPALEFVEFVLQQVCEHPDDIEITDKIDERGTLISVKVHDEDMGRLIGRDGQTVSALRTLLNVMSARENNRFYLKIIDPREVETPAEAV
ncbi:MAG: KH domain-containing protein [Candidatus Gracilibacteria bacterium]|nr:KH domain-containing protein [Candidatus Gracilibacteria bacterium]